MQMFEGSRAKWLVMTRLSMNSWISVTNGIHKIHRIRDRETYGDERGYFCAFAQHLWHNSIVLPCDKIVGIDIHIYAYLWIQMVEGSHTKCLVMIRLSMNKPISVPNGIHEIRWIHGRETYEHARVFL